MAKKRYADDYELIDTEDDAGNQKRKVVYRGDFYEIGLDEEGIRHFRRNCFLTLVAVTFLHIASGFVANRGMYQFYISLPYVLAFFPLLYMGVGIMRLPREKRKFQRDEIGHSFGRIKNTSLVLLIILGILALGEIIYLLFLSAGDQIGLEFLFLAVEALAGILVFFIIRQQREITITIQTGQKNTP